MNNKEVSNKKIDEKLNEIMEYVDEQIDEYLPKIVRLLAKLIYNLRFDLNELKLELIKAFKNEEGKPELEELKMGPKDLKNINTNLEDCLRDPSRYS